MKLGRARRQFRVLRKGAAALVTIYGRERNLRGVVSQAWRVTTRQGLIGLHDWLVVSNAPPPTVVTEEEALPHAPTKQELYGQWLARFDPLREPELSEARRHLRTLDLPGVLILAVVTPGAVPLLSRMAASWRESIHPDWQAALLPAPGLSAAEMDQVQAAASRAGAAVLATEEDLSEARARAPFTLVCAGAVLLNPLSLYMFLEAATRTGAGLVYSDHDLVDENGTRSAPSFKPQYSPEYLSRFNYVGACFLLARAVPLDAAALLRSDLPSCDLPSFDLPSFDLPGFDLARFDRMVARLARGRTVEHLPFTLFHMAEALPHAVHDLAAVPDTGPTAAIIIPTRDGLAHLRACIDSIAARTTYDLSRVEVVVVDNNSADPEMLDYLAELASRPRFTVVRFPEPFNFSAVNNAGARATEAEVLVFVNDDTEVHDPAWLSKLVWHAGRPGVGIVGGRLLFPDGTVQHGGCAAGTGRGTVAHLLSRLTDAEAQAVDHTREMTTVTGACIAVRRTVFERIGGFDPILRITWNDVHACLQCLALGLRNVYLADSLLLHDESKTRGPDTTREHYLRFFGEADYTRRRFRTYFYDDPSYSPNLSSELVGELAEPPRTRLPWWGMTGDKPRILVLSAVYKVGFGVPLVIHQQALKLVQLGYDVHVGGPEGENEFGFPGCTRVVLGSVKEAAEYAFAQGMALVVCHTPPFFTLPILLGGHIPVLAYDYGEPGAEFFPEPVRSYLLEVGYQKREAAALTSVVATISQAVKDETLNKDALVLGLANSHLPAWSEAFRPGRDRFRREHGWADAFVVLTVCRFHENERAYKGLDKIATILREMPYLHPGQSRSLRWVLVGAGTPEDVAQVERLGFTVFPNVSDEVLAELYRAADAYMGMSRWEGYNLGISQALAMGLPTLGSDIPAHREFPIATTDSVLVACNWLAKEVERGTAAGPERRATIYEWERSTTAFAAVVADMLRNAAMPRARPGASGCAWEDGAAGSPALPERVG